MNDSFIALRFWLSIKHAPLSTVNPYDKWKWRRGKRIEISILFSKDKCSFSTSKKYFKCFLKVCEDWCLLLFHPKSTERINSSLHQNNKLEFINILKLSIHGISTIISTIISINCLVLPVLILPLFFYRNWQVEASIFCARQSKMWNFWY